MRRVVFYEVQILSRFEKRGGGGGIDDDNLPVPDNFLVVDPQAETQSIFEDDSGHNVFCYRRMDHFRNTISELILGVKVSVKIIPTCLNLFRLFPPKRINQGGCHTLDEQ